MSDAEASPTGEESTAPSSVPSPELFKLTLAELTEEDKEKAAKIKAEANKAFIGAFYPVTPLPRHQESPLPSTNVDANSYFYFSAHEFKKAADLYSQALDKNPFDATVWCNRAYARIKLEEHGYALNDASTAFFSSSR